MNYTGDMTDPDHDWFEDVRWNNRLLVISGKDHDAKTQCEHVRAEAEGMLERDLIAIDASGDTADLLAGARDDLPTARILRDRFSLPTDTFQVVLVGKDGEVKERRSDHFEIQELFRIIDAMPMRMQEMRERIDP